MWNTIDSSRSIPFVIAFSRFHDNFFSSAADSFSVLICELEKQFLSYSEAVWEHSTKILIDVMPDLTESVVSHWICNLKANLPMYL